MLQLVGQESSFQPVILASVVSLCRSLIVLVFSQSLSAIKPFLVKAIKGEKITIYEALSIGIRYYFSFKLFRE